MKIKAATFTLSALALATAAGAAEMSDHDTNADGVLSVEEFATAYPDADPSVFAAIDANEDGVIDPAEFAAATAEGGPLAE